VNRVAAVLLLVLLPSQWARTPDVGRVTSVATDTMTGQALLVPEARIVSLDSPASRTQCQNDPAGGLV
jgi:hypothetical protein